LRGVSTATGTSTGGGGAAAAALADFLAAGFLVEILGINCVWLATGSHCQRAMRGESLPALDGLRQEKFKLDLLTDWDFISNRHGEYRSQRH
jgi:hypothetical protein